MKLIVGLGNPGKKYQSTRHNVGFEVIAILSQRFASGKAKNRFQGETWEANIHGERCLLLCPLTYMNLSGRSVQPALEYYRIQPDELLVICDDFHLDLGTLRFRPQGSSGGQKGLADIIRCLGTDEVPRLRMGVGPLTDRWDAADFVLSRFSGQHRELAQETILSAAEGVESWISEGIEQCMNRYNGLRHGD
ncbi:MAG: aminoacyl-tRNA hydrolase [Pirellulaceae bacterium]|nr:aminoacyl-tRNA hydrolase [Pirellulaceae bacterium]